MRGLVRDYAIVAAAAAVVFFVNLGGPRLWDRDEPRNAGCAREMLAAGDWVTPIFNAELRPHKPVLLYWFTMTAYAVFGVNEFAARFWSAALALGTALGTYHLGRRMFNARVGRWAGVILSSALMFDVAARAATPDSVLIFFSTMALLVYVLATFPAREPEGEEIPGMLNHPSSWIGGIVHPSTSSLARSARPSPGGDGWTIDPSAAGRGTGLPWLAAVLLYGLMGMAVLAKGPVGLVLPTAVIGMFLLIVTLPANEGARWWLRPLRPFAPLHFLRTCWTMRPLTALGAALAVALPWYVAVHLRTDGEWTRGFFLDHNLNRAATAMEGHDGSILFYPAAVLMGFFPWSVFAAPVLIDLVVRLRKGDRWRAGYLFAACWVGVYVGLFSLAKTKLPSYVTPMYPALALLTSCFLHHWTRDASRVAKLWPRLALASLAVVGVAVTIAVPVAARKYAPGDEWLGVLGLVPLAVALAALYLMERNRTLAAARVFAGGAVAFTALLFGLGAVRADRHQHSDVLLNAIDAQSDEPQIGAFGCLEPSWVFYAGRPIRPLGREQLTQAADGFFASEREAFVITTRRHLRDVEETLPAGVQVLAEAPYFLKDEQLVLLGRTGPVAATALQPPDQPRR